MKKNIPPYIIQGKLYREKVRKAEKFPGIIKVTDEGLAESLFGKNPLAEVIIGYLNNEPASFAVFYHTFSTTVGKHGLHVDDLYVKPHLQGKGIGKRMVGYLADLGK